MTERQIFTLAVEINDPARLEAFLSQACGADQELRARIDELLAAHNAPDSQFLKTPVVDQLQESTDPGVEKTIQLPPKEEPDEEELPGQPDLSHIQPSSKPGSIGTLGHYEILSILGHGAFGIVFKAFDEKLHRHVAIKMMSAQIAATSPARKRFLREARAAAAIRHDNVTQVYSVEEEPVPYLVMEFIDGQTLQSKQRKQGPLEVAELLHIGRQIAAGLAAAHEKSLIHRDVKPGNILLEQGAEQKVKITDFGLARAADDASLTRSGMISGTPLYMAPEQALGGTLDGRSDLFSLGSVLYELATGRPPFRAPTTVAVLRRVVDDTPRPMREIIPELPEWFVTIVSRLLEKNPDQRFQSAKEVADLLAKCQAELQLNGEVTCVSGTSPRSGSRETSAAPAASGKGLTTSAAPPNAKKPPLKTVLYALFLGLLVISPILFGKHLSRLTSSWFFGSIPTLPTVERAAGLRFDGENDFVQVPVTWDLPQFTIEAFVTPAEAGPHRTVVELTNYGSGTKDERLELFDAVGGKGERLSHAHVMGRSGSLSAFGPQTPGVREHRAIVCDGQEIHYYINGVWQGKRKNQPQDNQLWRMRWLTIGCQLGEKNFFKGDIDQLRISKVARYVDNFSPVTLVESDDATLALYNFEEGQGDLLKDLSGNGLDAKISGPTWIHPAQGLQFDGVDDYVEIPGLSWNSNQYTIEAYISQDGGHGNLFQAAGTGGMLHMYLYPKGGGAGISRDQVYANANGPRKGKSRQHLAVVYDGKNLNYFVQGQLAGVKTNVSTAATPMPLDRMMIGSKLQSDPSKPEFFEGRVERLRVSNNVRYVLPFQPGELKTDDATLALYDFTTGQGDTVKDVSGRSPDGKIVGATRVNSANTNEPSAIALAGEEWIDAMSLIDPAVDKLDLPRVTGSNAWKWENGVLVIGPDKLASKLILPLDSAWSAFECELEFTRRSGAGGLNLNIPTRTGECSVVIDHASGNGGVFLGARGKGVVLSEGAKIETGKRTTLNLTVRRQQNQDRVTVQVNGQEAEQWEGNRDDIGKESHEDFPVSRRISIWIHEGNNEFEFRRIRIRPLDGETVTATRPRTSWHGWPADAPKPAIAPFNAEQAKKHQEEWAAYLKVPVEYTNSIGMKFRLIPPGEFTMGMTKMDAEVVAAQNPNDEHWKAMSLSSAPEHRVLLTQPFYTSKYEVTQEQYEEVMGTNPSRFSASSEGLETKQRPAEMVSYINAAEFCIKLSRQENIKPAYLSEGETISLVSGDGYRLPTEAEWENACRAGTQTAWSSGEQEIRLGTVAWFAENSNGTTHPVGLLSANPFGLYDMHGNVWEWCQDRHAPQTYSQRGAELTVDPRGPVAGAARVLRGGDWNLIANYSRSALRTAANTNYLNSGIGFRVLFPVDAARQTIKVTSPAIPHSRANDLKPESADWHGWPADAPKPAIAPFSAEQAKKHQEEWAAYLKVPVEYTNSIGMKFRLIPPGEFLMGAPQEEIDELVASNDPQNKVWEDVTRSQGPQHRVVLTQPFYAGVHEVTQGQYQRVVGTGPATPPEGSEPDLANHPEKGAVWGDAVNFTIQLSELEKLPASYLGADLHWVPRDGTGYRLPSESQWEFAARAGTMTRYWSGSTKSDLLAVDWVAENSENRTHAVGEKPANPFGLFDVHGNAIEWTENQFDPAEYTKYQSIPVIDPPRHLKSDWHAYVARGGANDSWGVLSISSAFRMGRSFGNPSIAPDSGGFRVVLSVDAVKEMLKTEADTSGKKASQDSPQAGNPLAPTAIWSAPVNLGSAINTPAREANPSLTSDELLLVFTRGEELFEARRASRDEPFAPATKLAGPLPSAKFLTSCLSGDGLQLVLSAIPPGGNAQDVMIATRTSRDEPFGQPVALPQSINAPGEDRHPVLSPDGLILALTSVRGGQQTGGLLIFTRPNPTAEFNPTPTVDARLQGSWSVINSFSSDGRGLLKTTMADNVETITWHTRTADSPDWSEGQPLPAPFDAIKFGAPFLSADGNTIYFHSRYVPDGQGDLDLWMSRRTMKTP